MTISAKVIADSITNEIRITTFELEYPRFIHAEFMTHRLFSRNAASSRAIPIKAQIELIQDNPAMPIHWGKHQPGMQAAEECDHLMNVQDWGYIEHYREHYPYATRKEAWLQARDYSIHIAEKFAEAGYHKQIVNRLLEPFAHIKVVCTATEYDNFFWLRRHPDAQPEIRELADCMWNAREASTPVELGVGDWHVPYYQDGFIKPDQDPYAVEMGLYDDQVKQALMISSSCCAQVSYRKTDDTLEKAQKIYERLIEAKPVHASPFEQQATPVGDWAPMEAQSKKGLTHMDTKGQYWSGNFRGWVQYRQLIDEHTCWEYTP